MWGLPAEPWAALEGGLGPTMAGRNPDPMAESAVGVKDVRNSTRADGMVHRVGAPCLAAPAPSDDLGNLPEWYRVFFHAGTAIVRFPTDAAQPPVVTRYLADHHAAETAAARMLPVTVRHR